MSHVDEFWAKENLCMLEVITFLCHVFPEDPEYYGHTTGPDREEHDRLPLEDV
jgi:hypothetical protein